MDGLLTPTRAMDLMRLVSAIVVAIYFLVGCGASSVLFLFVEIMM